MAFKLKYKNLIGVVEQLRGAVKAHGKQADTIEKHIDSMEGDSPMQHCGCESKTLPGVSPFSKKDKCYHKAKAKYDVFPSAYASGYIAKCRKRGGKIA